MGWVLIARGLSFSQFRPNLPAGNQISAQPRTGLVPCALASPSVDSSPGKAKGSGRQRRRPTAADVRLAIGVDERPQMNGGIPSSPPSSSPPPASSSSRLMDFLATTPIGQPESPAERTLRQFGEWLVDRTEANSGDVLLNLMFLCLSLLPMWILLLLVASGIIKLPFSLPAIEDLIL